MSTHGQKNLRIENTKNPVAWESADRADKKMLLLIGILGENQA
jgi:hypothetical protein